MGWNGDLWCSFSMFNNLKVVSLPWSCNKTYDFQIINGLTIDDICGSLVVELDPPPINIDLNNSSAGEGDDTGLIPKIYHSESSGVSTPPLM